MRSRFILIIQIISIVRITCEYGCPIIEVTVHRGEKRPYHLSDKGLKPNGVYIRHGVISIPASEDNIQEMIRQSDGFTFDKVRSLHQELTFEYAMQYFAKRKVNFSDQNKQTLGMIDNDGYYTNTALILSDQCQHSLKCGIYEGTGKSQFKTRKEFSGSILKQMEDCYEFIDLSNNCNSDFNGLLRVDSYDYPQYAIREALFNAIIHRDYDYPASTIISIFSDRIEFLSLGGLVKGLSMADIMQGASQSRNMTLASIFYRLELTECYGTGIQRIMESYQTCDRQPSFHPAPASFLTILPNTHVAAQPQSSSFRYETAYEDYSLTVEERVMKLVRAKHEISRQDVQELLRSSSFPAAKALVNLQKQGKLLKIGNARATRYIEKE